MTFKVGDSKLKPCPFCGEVPEIEPWHGGKPTKKLVSCINDACGVSPMVSGETMKEVVDKWNRRVKCPM